MKIENFTHSSFLLAFLVLLIFNTPSYSQLDSRTTLLDICEGGDKNGSLCGASYINGRILQSSAEEIEVTLPVHITKDVTNSQDYEFEFPEDYPEPFLRYEYSPNEFRYTSLADNWNVIEERTTERGDLYFVFRSENIVRIQKPKVYTCESERSSFEFNMNSRLYTFSDEKNEFVEYPVYDYADSDDIFSCTVFKETMHICDPKLDPMELDTEVNICVPCIPSSNELTVLSNPFSNNLSFNYESIPNTKLRVSLLSTNGSLMSSRDVLTKEGVNRITISTADIPSGTYFLNVVNGKKKIVKKVVCLQQ